MFSYNPTVQNNAGEIAARNQMYAAEALANAQVQASQIEAEGRRRRQQEMAQLIGTALSTGVGFAVGGPVGGALALAGGAAGMMGDTGAAIAPALQTLAGSYANNQALKAKDNAYMGFFKRHGEDLGFDTNYLDELKGMKLNERVAAFDLMTGQPGQRLGSLNYLNQQMGPRAAYGTGAAASAAPRESFTF